MVEASPDRPGRHAAAVPLPSAVEQGRRPASVGDKRPCRRAAIRRAARARRLAELRYAGGAG